RKCSEGTSGKEEQRFCSENVKLGASLFGKQCSCYERKENTHEYCTRPWCLGGRLLLERRHRAPAGRRLPCHVPDFYTNGMEDMMFQKDSMTTRREFVKRVGAAAAATLILGQSTFTAHAESLQQGMQRHASGAGINV